MKKNIATHKVEVAKKKAIRDAEIAKQKAEEEARLHRIESGKIVPMKHEYNLDPEETAYISFAASKWGQVQHTVSATHKQDVASRASCGCCLFGPVGALLGGATAPSKTTQKTYESTGSLDDGVCVFTDKRFLFIGRNSIKSLPYANAISVHFNHIQNGSSLQIKYTDMVDGEHYRLFGTDSKVAEVWYKGIREKEGSIKNKK